MRKKVDSVVVRDVADPGDVDSLYLDFLKCFYEDGNHTQAEKVAVRLEAALVESPELAESIRGEEIRSLIAELREDFPEAIRSREAEIRKILELHTLAVNTPSWVYVSREYDFSDVSDRLDLLALLLDRHGETDRAIATLRESQHYCGAHHIPFDGQDLLDELERPRNTKGANGARRGRKRKPIAPTRRVGTP